MRKSISIALCVLICCSCFNQTDKVKAEASKLHMASASHDTLTQKETEQQRLPIRFLGIYTGLQPGYNLRNTNGEDIEVRGEKVPVPPCEYKFIFKQDNEVALQQVNLESNQRILYKGHYTIVEEDDHQYTLSCTVNDGGDSSPNYTIEINKQDKTMMCYGTNEPEFRLNFGHEVIKNATPTHKDSADVESPLGH